MTTYTAMLTVERIRCDACQKLDIGSTPLMILYRDDGTPMHACDGNNDACVKVVRELVKKPLSKPGDIYEALAREAVIGKLKGLVAEDAEDTVDIQAALAPTKEDVRAALLDLRRRYSAHASLAVMQRYADNWRVPLLDSVPPARYADLIADCKSWTPA